MKAQTLNINMHVPCKMKCPFCMARLTYKTGINNNERLIAALPKVIKYATLHQTDTALITGIGEPTDKLNDLFVILHKLYNSPVPIIELQTHGLNLYNDYNLLRSLKQAGLNTISISVCSMDFLRSAEIMQSVDPKYNYNSVIKEASDLGFLVRLSLNIIKNDDWDNFPEWAEKIKGIGLHQLTLRQIGSPDETSPHHQQILEWIKGEAASEQIINNLRAEIEQPGRLLRRLGYGAMVYDYKGISTSIVTCMTDNPNPDEIRSVILQPDGHCYHSWNFKGSAIW